MTSRTSRLVRIYTAAVAAICVIAVAVAIGARRDSARAQGLAAQWQAETRQWHRLTVQTVARDHLLSARLRTVVLRYDLLVHRTRTSQAHLLGALRQAQRSTATAQTVYQSLPPAPVAPAPVAGPAPAPASVPAPAPTTHTSGG